MNKKKSRKSILPYHLIRQAVNGDVDAINAVLRHYDDYISYLSTIQIYDENGILHLWMDEEMRRRLETKLIIKILAFRVA